MTEKGTQDVRTYVRERYGKIAEEQIPGSTASCAPTPSSCCGSGEDTSTLESKLIQMYDIDVAGLPEEVTDLSLGCGDPVTLAALEPGQTVLDLGSGGGIDCFLAARQVGPTGMVIGVDMTPAMLDRARANKAKMGVTNVDFRLGEIEHLPVADQSVDVVISNCVINLSPDKPQVFRDAFRVLKPGGKLAVSDIVTDGPLPQVIKDNLSAWAGCVAGAMDVADYVAAIERAGFHRVEVNPVYWQQEAVIEAVDQYGEKVVLDDSINESIQKSIFSAKVTAYKPDK